MVVVVVMRVRDHNTLRCRRIAGYRLTPPIVLSDCHCIIVRLDE